MKSICAAGQKFYNLLLTKCYICEKKDNHIFYECPMFDEIEGNLNKFRS